MSGLRGWMDDLFGVKSVVVTPQAVRFRHTKANSRVEFGDVAVDYLFVRARRKTIGFLIGPEGLEVRAPIWAALPEVHALLQGKSEWILRKLQAAQQRQERLASARIVWADGVDVPYLGGHVQVQLNPASLARAGAHLVAADAAGVGPVLQLRLPRDASPSQIRDATQSWLMQQAKAHFIGRLHHFADLLGVRWTRLRLSSASTRWGSASADGSVRLNWRLIHLSPATVDYVVAHELSHLRVMDHSQDFWNTVASVVPDYKQRRRALMDDAVPQW